MGELIQVDQSLLSVAGVFLEKIVHICYMTRSTLQHQNGGMERHGDILVRGLARKGHRISTITTPLSKPLHETGPESRSRKIFVGSKSSKYSAQWWKQSHAALRELNRADPIDIVWSQSVAGFGSYLFQKDRIIHVPHVAIMHGTFPQEFTSNFQNASSLQGFKHLIHFLVDSYPRHINFIRNKAFRKIDHYIAINESIAAALNKDFHVDQEKLSIIHNGIDSYIFRTNLSKEKLTNLRIRLGIEPESIVLVSVGRVHYQKGLHLMIEAMESFRGLNITYLVIGSGPQLPGLQKLVRDRELQSQIIFTGDIENSELNKYLPLSDIFVFPSLHAEGQPLAMLEAMAAGLPVVASHIPGVSEILNKCDAGLVFPKRQTHDMVMKIRQLCEDDSRRTRMGENGRAYIRQFCSSDVMVDQVEEVFRDLVTKWRK